MASLTLVRSIVKQLVRIRARDAQCGNPSKPSPIRSPCPSSVDSSAAGSTYALNLEDNLSLQIPSLRPSDKEPFFLLPVRSWKFAVLFVSLPLSNKERYATE